MSPMIKLPLNLEHALLGFLAERPMHAYEMYLHLQATNEIGRVWHIKQSQLYAMLGRLEEAGHITTTMEPQGARPPRKMLQLTPQGRAAFDHWLRMPVAHGRDFRQEFMAKLYFANEDDPRTVAELIDAQQHACREWIDDLRRQADAMPPAQAYDRLVLQFRAGQVEAIMTWLDTCALTLVAPEPLTS